MKADLKLSIALKELMELQESFFIYLKEVDNTSTKNLSQVGAIYGIQNCIGILASRIKKLKRQQMKMSYVIIRYFGV